MEINHDWWDLMMIQWELIRFHDDLVGSGQTQLDLIGTNGDKIGESNKGTTI